MSCAESNKLVLIIVLLMMLKLNIYNILRYSRSAASMRDSYKDHFTSSIGEVSWQYHLLGEHIYNCIMYQLVL